MAVKPIPDRFHSVTPYLFVDNGAKALEFYQKAFGGEELFRMNDPSGRIGHAEVKIGNSIIMLSDEYPEMDARGPNSLGGTPIGLYVYVQDVDAVFSRAIQAGGRVVKPVADQFYGDRCGALKDPFGHLWTLATHKEDLTREELDKRAQEAMKQGCAETQK